jgi:hypothetical protein
LPVFPDQFGGVTKAGFARMTKKHDKPSAEQPADAKPSRSEEARRIIQEYVNDLLEIIKKLRRRLN